MSNFNDLFNTQAVTTRHLKATTENGAKTNATTKNAVLDLFAIVGSMRTNPALESMFEDALASNEDLAVRLALWARDIRGGAGERAVFRRMLNVLGTKYPELAIRVARKIPEVGRFDDLLLLEGTKAENEAFEVIRQALLSDNGLCAKWMPRQDRKGAKGIRNYMGMTPKQWRTMLVKLSDGVVEQKMSAGNWAEINFSHVPSVASSRLQKAFGRNAPEQYSAYLRGLETGVTKVNASAIFPHDVIKHAGSTLGDTQWKSLPNYLEGSTETILPVVDVSGSMGMAYLSGTSTRVLDVAVAMGIYIAERNETKFGNKIISFSGSPNFHSITGTLAEKVHKVKRSGEDMSTNLMGVFETLLREAKRNNWKDSDMPNKLLILSDMEFNQVDGYSRAREKTNFQAIKKLYKEAGYTRPHLVFWNLNGRPNNNPVKMATEETTLVSGFSPAVLKVIATGKTTNPMEAMLETLLVDRYNY